MKQRLLYLVLVVFQSILQSSWSFSTLHAPWQVPTGGTAIASPDNNKKKISSIGSYEHAFEIIDEAAAAGGEPTEELYRAVRYVEVNSYKLYSDPVQQQKLWDTAHGSWKLLWSTGSNKSRKFKNPPAFLPFSFAMIDEEHFGNGIGLNEDTIWLAFLHRHNFHSKHRRMVVNIEEAYIAGRKVNLPSFVQKMFEENKKKEKQQQQETTNDKKKQKPPPTFVIVGCSDKALIARGNQSGGLALWTRLPQDIRRLAYSKKE